MSIIVGYFAQICTKVYQNDLVSQTKDKYVFLNVFCVFYPIIQSQMWSNREKNNDRCERALQENLDRSLSVSSQSERAYYLSHIIIDVNQSMTNR